MTKIRIAVQDFTKYGKGNWKTKSKTIVTKLSYKETINKVFAFFETLRGD